MDTSENNAERFRAVGARTLRRVNIDHSDDRASRLELHPNAEWALSKACDDYRHRIGAEADRRARLERLDGISTKHIDEAVGRDRIVEKKTWHRHFSAIGGVLAGASLSTLLTSILSDTPFQSSAEVALLGLFVLGVALIAWSEIRS